MIGPTYIHVPDGRRPLRIAAFRHSQQLQIMRIGGAHLPHKTSTICGFATAELRPDHRQAAEAHIRAQTTSNYWLTVQVFGNAGDVWHQSTMRPNAFLEVPALELVFDDYVSVEGGTEATLGLSVSIVYEDAK